MDLLTPAPGRKVLWSFDDIYLLRYNYPGRSIGYVVSSRFQDEPLLGLTQKVRILARLFTTRQVFQARLYLLIIKENYPDLFHTLPQDFWDYFAVKTDELHPSPNVFLPELKEYANGPNSH